MKISHSFYLCMLFAAVCFLSCSSNSTKYDKKKKIDQILSGKYIYYDKNSVYHIDPNCVVLTIGSFKADESEEATYSVIRLEREGICWKRFARGNHLCVQCFTDEVLDSLEAHQ